MSSFAHFNGYQPDFLGSDLVVDFPSLSEKDLAAVAPVEGSDDNILHYQNFSLVQNAKRRMPFYTATNINGRLFKTLGRHDSWRQDPRIASEHQWGSKLYKAEKSDFDKGHMTKREDVQWGVTDEEAKKGAKSTFYYTNAVPQVAKLNRQLWRSLEDYILKSESVSDRLKVNMFTGPVLSDTDPVFVTEVDGEKVRIPTLFWKVIYFAKSDGQMYRVAFLMGQEDLLEKMELVHPRERGRSVFPTKEEKLFMEFKKADVFQVNIDTIKTLTKFEFPEAIEPFKDERSTALIRKEVQGRGGLFGEPTTSVEITGLVI